MNDTFEAPLFALPESKSPRLLWLERHQVQTYKSPCMAGDDDPWGAWVGDLENAINRDSVARGPTEDEAIVNLAKAMGIKLWNEE